MVILTREHLRIVDRVHWHYYHNMPVRYREDMIGAGMLGLVKASIAYDPEKGRAFRNYAWLRVHGEMQDHLRSVEGRKTADGELSCRKPKMIATDPTSQVFVSPVDPVGDWELADALNTAISLLSARERYAVRMVCLQGHTLGSVGRTLGITESGVCLLLQRARKRMRVSVAA